MMYQYYEAGNRIICVSSYAGRKVRGVAICSSKDTFNKELGMTLARLRCDRKVAEKRLRRANQKLDEAADAFEKARIYYDKMLNYYDDALYERDDLNDQLQEFIEKSC